MKLGDVGWVVVNDDGELQNDYDADVFPYRESAVDLASDRNVQAMREGWPSRYRVVRVRLVEEPEGT